MTKKELVEEIKKTMEEIFPYLEECLTERELRQELIKLKTSLEMTKSVQKVMDDMKDKEGK